MLLNKGRFLARCHRPGRNTFYPLAFSRQQGNCQVLQDPPIGGSLFWLKRGNRDQLFQHGFQTPCLHSTTVFNWDGHKQRKSLKQAQSMSTTWWSKWSGPAVPSSNCPEAKTQQHWQPSHTGLACHRRKSMQSCLKVRSDACIWYQNIDMRIQRLMDKKLKKAPLASWTSLWEILLTQACALKLSIN